MSMKFNVTGQAEIGHQLSLVFQTVGSDFCVLYVCSSALYLVVIYMSKHSTWLNKSGHFHRCSWEGCGPCLCSEPRTQSSQL